MEKTAFVALLDELLAAKALEAAIGTRGVPGDPEEFLREWTEARDDAARLREEIIRLVA